LLSTPITSDEFEFASKINCKRGRSSIRGSFKRPLSYMSAPADNNNTAGNAGAIASSSAASTGGEEGEGKDMESGLDSEPGGDGIDFAEFVVLEMLRLNRVEQEDLRSMRDIFDVMDSDGSGEITYEELTMYHASMTEAMRPL
jgi:hypothetical protein